MRDEYQGEARFGGKCSKQFTERFEATGGGSNRDDRESR